MSLSPSSSCRLGLATVTVFAMSGVVSVFAQELSDRVLIKLSQTRMELETGAGRQLHTLPTGIAELDVLLERYEASSIRPIFPEPPRGRANPEAAAHLGLWRWHRVELGSEREDIREVAESFAQLASVELAELDRKLFPAVIPDDPDYVLNQWDLKPDRSDAESAWDIKTDSSDVIVCVIDTGCETAHGDIASNVWINQGEIPGNGIDDDANGYIDDINGWNFLFQNDNVQDSWPHGIHVNGIIGAVGNNSTKVAGINWVTRLMQGKIFDAGFGTWEAGAEATVYAADNGAKVTNNSWGDTGQGPSCYVDAMNYADSLDVLQVAAAGNQGDANEFWPAAYEPILAVSATDVNDNLAGFSSHGSWIDMSAPGQDIYNLWIGNGATWLSGTSMASPHVAGAGALIRSVNPQLRAREAFLVLRYHSDDLGGTGFDDSFGYGRLDIRQAVDAARSIRLSTLTTSVPGTVDIDLDMETEHDLLHLLLATPAGEVPGIPLSSYDPADACIFPLNYDFFMTFLLAVQPNPIGQNFVGNFDGSGHSDASFVIPSGAYFKGKDFSFCYVTFDPNDLSQIRRISAPLTLHVNL